MSEKEVRARLKNLPPGLDEVYKETVERIRNQAPGEVEKAIKVLAWICFSTRPLEPIELQHAVAVELAESEFDNKNITGLDDLVSLCAGLVAVDEKTNVIRLSHYTTQEYFEKQWLQHFPDMQYQIAATCISCISWASSRYNLCTYSTSKFHSKFPLARYAIKNWEYHAREGYPETKEFIGKIFQNSKALECVMRIGLRPMIPSVFPLQIHFAAFFGLDKYIQDCLENASAGGEHEPFVCDQVDGGGRTALHWASEKGQIDSAKVLLQHGWKVDSVDIDGSTALNVAANRGHISLVHLLVERGADIEHLDQSDQTPLLNAASNGETSSVEALLRLGAKIDVVGKDNRNVLHWGARNRSPKMIELLSLQCDIRTLNFCDNTNMTPLLLAMIHQNEEVADLLIKNGYNVNAGIERKMYNTRHFNSRMTSLKINPVTLPLSDKNGLNPLHLTALEGDPKMTQYLLRRGADINVRDCNGDTPLHLSLRRCILGPYFPIDLWSETNFSRVETIAKNYRKRGIVIQFGFCRLTEARVETLDSLLKQGDIDVDMANILQESPLHLIHYEEEDSSAIFRMIMAKSPNILAANHRGETPLHLSCLKGNLETTRLMLDMESCAIKAQDSQRQTPFFYASRTQNESMIEMFWDYLEKANPNQWNETDLRGRTPFHYYLESGICLTKTIEAFLEHGANMKSVDNNGDCPLSIFLQPRRYSFPRNHDNREEICKLLLERGSDLNWKNHFGENLAHASMHGSNPNILGILKRYGVDIAASDCRDRNILHHGAMYGYVNEETINLIPEHIDLLMNQTDIYGMTPLSYAEHYADRDCYETLPFYDPPDRKLTLQVLKKAQSRLEGNEVESK